MTALKPLANLVVRGVPATKYPLNEKCAHPECSDLTDDAHHIFPRSQIGNSSWFVEIIQGPEHDAETKWIIPHVSGLCRKHHDEVERHDAWIKLEDNTFEWYERVKVLTDRLPEDDGANYRFEWSLTGPLNPRPGSTEGKPKRRKFKGEARRKRTTISIKVPQDEQEDGAGIFSDLVEQLGEKLSPGDPKPTYYTLIAALAFALANITEEDLP